MAIKKLADDLYIIPGLVNVYVLKTDDGLALLDTGFPNSAGKVVKGLQEIGLAPGDVRHILITHAHPDHIGSAGALERQTGATVWAHPVDAPIVEAGTGFRPVQASPGLRNRVLARLLLGAVKEVEATKVHRLLGDGESPSFLKDLTAIHSPGHCAGQIALIWRRRGGVLFTADTCVNRRGMTLPVATEDLAKARADLERLCELNFETICFMHGQPIMTGGDVAFRRVWSRSH